MTGLLDNLLERINKLPEKEALEVVAGALKLTDHLRWVPNPGPQSDAYTCPADELFYGGQAGPGKTDLILGLAVNQHNRSLILREFNEDARSASDRFLEILGTREGFNASLLRYVDDHRHVEFSGCKDEKDKQRHKGIAYDFYGFDEIGDFTKTQFAFITTWNRSTRPGQRCRVVVAGNPPTRTKGLWVIDRWGPWLNKRHPLYPIDPGVLLWFTTNEEGDEIYVDGPGPHDIGGRTVVAKSRTFIRGELKDNPDLVRTNYDANLSALPKELRDAYRDGLFDASLKDQPFQLIPTQWVQEAQSRWTDHPPIDVPMCAMAVDAAQGGPDQNIISARYDGWFAELIKIPGEETPVGTDVAGRVIAARRDSCVVVVDCGGGYGGAVFSHLKENGVDVKSHIGAKESTARSKQLKFTNKRAEVYWRFRDALDPSQEFGSPIALPTDPKILADLTAPTFEVVRGGVKVEAKAALIARIGGSTDEGDAIVMCWSRGPKGVKHSALWRSGEQGERGQNPNEKRPKVTMGHESARAAARR